MAKRRIAGSVALALSGWRRVNDMPCDGARDRYRVLVLDDEPLILLDLEFAIEDAGCMALTALALEEALAILQAESVAAAILDVTLGQGQTCEPVARELARRGIPYVLHTGDLDRMDASVRNLGGLLVPKPTPASVVVARALEPFRAAPHMA